MLIIPVAQEDSTVRRLPWVSLTLIALNAIVFALSPFVFDSRGKEAEIGRIVQEMARRLYLSPHLRVPAAVDPYLSEKAEAELEARREKLAPPASEVYDTQQHEIDDLGRQLRVVTEALPHHRFGFIPASPEPSRVVTSMFMHAGWMHFLGNMLFLFLAGPVLEDRFGRASFAVLYVLSGFAAANAHAMTHPNSLTPLIGASGAIAGVMGAFLVRLAAARIRFLVIPIVFVPAVRFAVLLPAFIVLPLWLGEQYLYARRFDSSAGVAFWAHIGGFLFGALFAAALRLSRVEEVLIHRSIEKDIGIEQNPGIERAGEARLRGDWATARSEIDAVLKSEPSNIDAWREAYETAAASGDVNQVGRAAGRLIELYERAREKQLAATLVMETLHDFRGRLPTTYSLTAAKWLEQQGDAREAIAIYEDVATRAPQDPSALRALIRIGDLMKQAGDSRSARRAYERAKAHPGCSELWRSKVETALAQLSA